MKRLVKVAAPSHFPPPLAQDVYDEILRNDVPLDEWPTYIFTRIYSARGQDHEIAALKAVARRTAAKQDAELAAAQGSMDAGRGLGLANRGGRGPLVLDAP